MTDLRADDTEDADDTDDADRDEAMAAIARGTIEGMVLNCMRNGFGNDVMLLGTLKGLAYFAATNRRDGDKEKFVSALTDHFRHVLEHAVEFIECKGATKQ